MWTWLSGRAAELLSNPSWVSTCLSPKVRSDLLLGKLLKLKQGVDNSQPSTLLPRRTPCWPTAPKALASACQLVKALKTGGRGPWTAGPSCPAIHTRKSWAWLPGKALGASPRQPHRDPQPLSQRLRLRPLRLQASPPGPAARSCSWSKLPGGPGAWHKPQGLVQELSARPCR